MTGSPNTVCVAMADILLTLEAAPVLLVQVHTSTTPSTTNAVSKVHRGIQNRKIALRSLIRTVPKGSSSGRITIFAVLRAPAM